MRHGSAACGTGELRQICRCKAQQVLRIGSNTLDRLRAEAAEDGCALVHDYDHGLLAYRVNHPPKNKGPSGTIHARASATHQPCGATEFVLQNGGSMWLGRYNRMQVDKDFGHCDLCWREQDVFNADTMMLPLTQIRCAARTVCTARIARAKSMPPTPLI